MKFYYSVLFNLNRNTYYLLELMNRDWGYFFIFTTTILNNELKSNFSGKDGFSWWIGRVAHPKYWKKQNLASAAAGSESHRVKVRIIGYHPWDDTLKENDLPWANVSWIFFLKKWAILKLRPYVINLTISVTAQIKA